MQESLIQDQEHQREIREKVESGEYFREARSWYSFMVHDPMAERYFFLLLVGLSLLVFLLSVVAMRMIYPLKSNVPFIVSSYDLVEDLPLIRPLGHPSEDPDAALLRFLAENYVLFREEYDLGLLERNAGGIQAHSAPEVFAEYQRMLDPRRPDSFVALYQRHSKRKVSIVSYMPPEEEGGEAEVVFDAVVDSKDERKRTRWVANIAFRASNIALDGKTGKPLPLEFVVTKYQSKRIQDDAL